jgi:DNA-binding NtrC family response regulator
VAERLLLVSADDAVAFAAGALVERGVELLRERDGSTGLAAALRVRPDVVMWDEDAVAVDRPLVARLHASGAAVLAIAPAGDAAAGVRALQLGAEQFIAKPVDPEYLAAAVARAADASRWRRVAERGVGGGGGEPHQPRTLAQVEREQIERALRHHRGNRTRAARELGISRATLINKIRVYALDL